MNDEQFSGIKHAIFNSLSQEYDHNNPILPLIIGVIEKDINEIKQESHCKNISKTIRNKILSGNKSNKWLPEHEINFILEIIEFSVEAYCSGAYDNNNNDDDNIKNALEIPYTLRDFGNVLISLRLLSFIRPIIITQLFGSLSTEYNKYDDANTLKQIF